MGEEVNEGRKDHEWGWGMTWGGGEQPFLNSGGNDEIQQTEEVDYTHKLIKYSKSIRMISFAVKNVIITEQLLFVVAPYCSEAADLPN